MPNPKDIPIQIDDYVSKVSDKLEPLQKSLFNKVSAQLKELSLDADGFIKRTSANMDIITAVKTELNSLLMNPKYNAIVNSVDGMLGDIDDMQGSYFQTIDPTIAAPPVMDVITDQAFQDAKTDLTKAGFQSEIVDRASTIVQTAITEGTSYADMNTQMADFITGNKNIDGKLVSYTKQILGDTLNNTSRNYNSIMTDKLGLEWFRYVGALVRDSRPLCKALEHKEWIHISELAGISRGIVDGQQVSRAGMMPDTNKDNFISRCGGYNCNHHAVPVAAESVPANIRRKFDKNVKQSESDIVEERPSRITNKNVSEDLTTAQQTELNSLERQSGLTVEDQALQEKSLKQFVTQKEKLTSDYIKENGNVVNTDEARKLFTGYVGTNASAVHEASSAVSKSVSARLLEDGTKNKVALYAGGAGSGKTSAVEKLFPKIREENDLIIDGNLSHYDGAMKKIASLKAAGKEVDINYVYRDPVDAWENGVISRMLNNKAEKGRIVPMSTFMQNTTGSLETVQTMVEHIGNVEGININLIDNSLGKGKTAFMDKSKFESIKYPDNLREILEKKTKQLLDEGKITRVQYEGLIR